MNIAKAAIVEKMRATGMIPVFNHEDEATAIAVMDAAYQAGIKIFEFTNRGSNAKQVFTALAKHASLHPDMLLGMGTIFSANDAAMFIDIGADFIVSPALVPEVAKACDDRDKLWIPGCATLTEVYQADQLGAMLIKAFPGNVLGPDFIAAIKSVMPHIKMMPTGGVTPTAENLKQWFKAGVSCVGMGSQLMDKKLIANGDFSQLQQQISSALSIVQSVRNSLNES